MIRMALLVGAITASATVFVHAQDANDNSTALSGAFGGDQNNKWDAWTKTCNIFKEPVGDYASWCGGYGDGGCTP